MDNRKRVVIADAKEEFRGALQKIVEDSGRFQVVASTGDGEEALVLVQQHRPDLLLMDMVLPGLDGLA